MFSLFLVGSRILNRITSHRFLYFQNNYIQMHLADELMNKSHFDNPLSMHFSLKNYQHT